MSAYHVSTLEGHIHDQITLFRILARFWWPMVKKEVDQFIRDCVHYQLVNSCSCEAKQLIQMIESDTPFDVVFLYSWETGDIQYWYGSCKILTCLYFMSVFGLGDATGMKKITL